jgi:3-oxoacyl-[acyl-carrier protein] reductase/pteridine reductase
MIYHADARQEGNVAEQALAGQVALVTGAARRIGRCIALRLAADGADVVVNYNHSEQDAKNVLSEIERAGRKAAAIRADVARRSDVQTMVARVEKEFGHLDILVNNAGTFFAAPFLELREEQWDEIMGTNVKAHYLCAQAAAPLMKRQGKGRIVNITSIGGLLAWPAFTHYCVSKAAAIMLTRCLARALAPEILVNSVAPGTIQFPGEVPDEDYIRRVPLHRTGKGEEIAEAVAYLCRAEFITGQVLVVDGGRVLV